MSKVQTFSPRAIDALRTGKMADPQCPGLAIEVDPNGAKTWRFKRKVKRTNTVTKATLGTFPTHSINDARVWAAPYSQACERGINLRATEKEEESRASMTVEAAHKLYIAASAEKRTKRGNLLKEGAMNNKREIWGLDIKPAIGTRSVFEITADDLWEIVESKGETAPSSANKLAAELKVMFSWFASRAGKKVGIGLETDPSRTLSGSHFGVRFRTRFLSEEELRLFLRALAKEDRIYRRALGLILVTGCRKTEVLAARADERKGSVWSIPGVRTKNSMLHRIPLPTWANSLFDSNDEWVIKSRKIEGGMVCGWPKVIERIRHEMERLGGCTVEHFV